MDISLTPDIERMLSAKVTEGLYGSLSEAINATLTLFLQVNAYQKKSLIC